MKTFLKLIFLLPLFFYSGRGSAQYVAIPDSNFAATLTALFPGCMNGDSLDVSCQQILQTYELTIRNKGIHDLSGIEYFTNLTYLNCNKNHLTNLPPLPSGLNRLFCDSNELTSLTALPASLIELSCMHNQLGSLPVLPSSLQNLYCGNNFIQALDSLPSFLFILSCELNLLTALPSLPTSLHNLIVDNNSISQLPDLPSHLFQLNCYNNVIQTLPALPNNLFYLGCGGNYLSSLPTLPDSLRSLVCYFNYLSQLPPLPSKVFELHCSQNQLSELPALPQGLAYLTCFYNQLTYLPVLPDSLMSLNCEQNQLTYIPAVPNQMYEFKISNNNISCVNNLPYNIYPNSEWLFGLVNNPLTCVPNQTFYSGGLPLCMDNDSVNNPNNCQVSNLSGRVYTDLNGDCLPNAGDLFTQNIPVKLYDQQNNFVALSYTLNGMYSFGSMVPDSYFVKIDTLALPLEMNCGISSMQTFTLDSSNQNLMNLHFPVACNVDYDLRIQSVHHEGWVFPGQIHNVQTNILSDELLYHLVCNGENTSGTVELSISGPVSYHSPQANALTPLVNGNTLTYNISNFNDITSSSFGIRLLTDTTAQANDQVCVHVHITPFPQDADTLNNTYNFCYQVVNSYDPNMKEVYPQSVLPGYDDWFTYTIHFQNTGTAPAFNIRLRDTLDLQLDRNTFEVLGYSHPASVQMNNNLLTIRFNNIMLPDSTTDYDGSMGYFQYRIKPLPNLPLGSQIKNTAYIYFDYNPPIVTNTTQNNFEFPVGLKQTDVAPCFVVYPNPGNGLFVIKDARSIQTVEVYNLLGEQVLATSNNRQINLLAFPRGVYIARINGSRMVKLVKE